MSVTIRDAGPADAALVLHFIRALAAYEKLLPEVRTTEADVRAMLFCDHPRAFCDVAELGGRPVGFAIWFYSASTFEGRHGLYLEDLFVEPEARGRGAGVALLKRLARRCRDEGLTRMEWAVLDWNAPSIAFYDRLGASTEAQWLRRRLNGAALARLAE